MKTIEELHVKVTYEVGLGNVQVPEKIYNQLMQIEQQAIELNSMTEGYSEAHQWLVDHIKEADCCECTHEVEVFTEG